MLKYFIFFIASSFFSCSAQQTNKTEPKTLAQQYVDTVKPIVNSIESSMPDPIKVAKFKEYATDWNESEFPAPTPSMLVQSSDIDPGYLYISNSFDSLTAKISTENTPSIGTPCSWKQSFKSGIIYSKSTCMAGGTKYSIQTSSKDKQILIRLIDVLFYTSENDWNSDSTQYTPLSEMAGSYYLLEKSDAGNYSILYSCSYK
jgi:hypothetical protein